LRQEVAAKAAGSVIEHHGRAPKIARAGEPDEAVAQIFPLQEEEDHKNQDDARRRERLKQRGGDLLGDQERRRTGLVDFDRDRALPRVVG
jgi:hypothetical protein